MIRMTLVGDTETIARFEKVSNKIYDNLRAVIQEQWFGLQSYIVTAKLSGQVLKRRTGLLASSINVGGPQSTSKFTADQTQIVGKVGTAVVYAPIHEYGGTIAMTSKLGKAYSITMPERSFLRSGLQDKQSEIRAAIQQAIDSNMRELTST